MHATLHLPNKHQVSLGGLRQWLISIFASGLVQVVPVTMSQADSVSPLQVARGPSPRRSGFRPDIEGLRAVAVLGVVLFHAGVPGLGGGFIGVDVFFVISGFLITGMLWREVSTTGGVRLGRFYGARARRLLPARRRSAWLPRLARRSCCPRWKFAMSSAMGSPARCMSAITASPSRHRLFGLGSAALTVSALLVVRG